MKFLIVWKDLTEGFEAALISDFTIGEFNQSIRCKPENYRSTIEIPVKEIIKLELIKD